MAVIPLVPETSGITWTSVDVGKQISLGNQLVRKVTWFVLTTTSAPLILSRTWPHDKDCLCILSSSKNSLSHILTSWDSTLSLFFISTSRNSLTLPLRKTQLNTRNMGAYTLCNLFLSCSAFSVTLVPVSNTATEISSNPERDKQYGRRHVPPRIHCYIFVYWFLTWNTLSKYIL